MYTAEKWAPSRQASAEEFENRLLGPTISNKATMRDSFLWRVLAQGVKSAQRFLLSPLLTSMGPGLPFLPELQNNLTAYWWSLASLLTLIGVALFRANNAWENNDHRKETVLFGYSSGLIVAVVVSVVYLRAQIYSESHTLKMPTQFFNIAGWSIVSHVAVAIAVLSGLNLISISASLTKEPKIVSRWMLCVSIALGLGIVLDRFLNVAMSFDVGVRIFMHSHCPLH
jgi:hypothetical protein